MITEIVDPNTFKSAFDTLKSIAAESAKTDRASLKSNSEIFDSYMDFLKTCIEGVPADERVQFAEMAEEAFQKAMNQNKNLHEDKSELFKGLIQSSNNYKQTALYAALAAAAVLIVSRLR